MASTFAELPASPAAQAGALPFMLAQPRAQVEGLDFAAAFEAAAIAESASHDARRNTRCRISYFLCEAANQLRQQRGPSFDFASEFPITRYDIADLLGISLCKVKRVVALLSLSGVVSTDGRSLQVLDWPRLCGVAHVDPERLGLVLTDEDEMVVATPRREEEPANLVTASGEPACFV